jgi:predicted nucleic acid-binding protein
VRKYLKTSQDEVDASTKRFRQVATAVESGLSLEVVEEDPADNRALECAVAAGASYTVSGDIHLLRIEKHRGIVILSPAEFLFLAMMSLR